MNYNPAYINDNKNKISIVPQKNKKDNKKTLYQTVFIKLKSKLDCFNNEMTCLVLHKFNSNKLDL